MSTRRVPVQWTRTKWAYDAVLLACVIVYVWVFVEVGSGGDVTRPVDGQILRIRAFGSCAFLMLTLVLCIGPLARLDARFLPLLYNRRHFGVITALVALTHAVLVLDWYYAFSPVPPIEALLSPQAPLDRAVGFPFELLGLLALMCLGLLAATSHDFWLAFLGPPVWKAIHLSIYFAYAAAVAHVALGYLQDTRNPAFAILFAGGAGTVVALHLLARGRDAPIVPEPVARNVDNGDWVPVCAPEEVPDGRAVVVSLGEDERAAVFRHGSLLSAVSNACAHQNGPLGEGRIVNGCITCPWHGFQFRPEDGCAPEPFTERIPTYRLRLKDGMVEINRRAFPPGTPVGPLIAPVDPAVALRGARP